MSARPLRAWLDLLRVSLAPSLAADLCAGVATAHGSPTRVAALFPASLLLFVGGMALNARVDLEEDRRTRPDRPLPSGAVPPRAATAVAVAALLSAPLAAWLAGGAAARDQSLWAAALAFAIALYHTPLKSSAVAGPLLLGSIRGGHLLFGAIAVAGLSHALEGAALAAVCYATYVAGASFVAHQEDRDARALPVRTGALLAFIAIVVHAAARLAATPPGTAAPPAANALAVVALWHLFSLRGALRLFRPGGFGLVPIAAYARLLLSRMALLPAAAAFAAGDVTLGLTAVVAFLAVFTLVRFVPPT